VVPVVRDADKKSFADLERDIADYAGRARDGKLKLEDLQGGTFTITTAVFTAHSSPLRF
jgi:Pyruvate/2-oxoglutarate dehydrogenase complex, dihydrolipoamide acyltransferase (E2) component, and related enzymes